MTWMNERAKAVFDQLRKHPAPDITFQESEDWRRVSTNIVWIHEASDLNLDRLLL
jgi:hypothetical protein